MLEVLVVMVGAVVGFCGSRALHRSGAAAPAAAAAVPPPRTRAAGTEASLARVDGDRHERFALTTGAVTIGRGADQDVTVAEPQVSRHHGTLRLSGPVWTYTDDGSSNGTRLNGEPVPAGHPIQLHHGDRLQVGRASLVFRQLEQQ